MQDARRKRRPRLALWSALAVVAVVALVFAFSDPILNTWVLPGFVQPRLHQQGINLQTGHLHWSFFTDLLRVESLRVDLPVDGRRGLLTAMASGITLRGPNWFAILLGKDISVNSVEVDSLRCILSPRDTLVPLPDSVETRPRQGPSRAVSIGRLELHAAAVGMHMPLGGVRVDTIASLSLSARGLHAGDGPPTASTIADMLGDAELKLSGARMEFGSPSYTMSLDSLDFGPALGLRIGGLTVHPSTSDTAFFAAFKFKSTRFAAHCRHFLIPRWRWDRDASLLTVPAVRFDSLRLDMLGNRRKPDDPDTTHLVMPNQMIARLPFGLSIDTVTVRRGLIKYGEQFVYDIRPATLAWTGFTIDAAGIANRPVNAPPATVEGRGIFMGGAPMSLRMSLPCTDTLFSMSYAGSLGAMLLPLLNPYLTISDRVRLTSGWCDSVRYEVRVRQGTAEGTVTPLYYGLRVQLLQEKSGHPGLGTGLASFVANALKLRSMNPEPEKPAKKGSVKRNHIPWDPFFGFLWKSLRGGLAEVIGFNAGS